MSARRVTPFSRRSARKSSKVLVEWPIVQMRAAGIHQCPFNRRARKERAGRGQVGGQLLVVLRQRLAGLQLEHGNAAAWLADEAVEGAAQDHRSVGGADGK